jgi:hypothetical protein
MPVTRPLGLVLCSLLLTGVAACGGGSGEPDAGDAPTSVAPDDLAPANPDTIPDVSAYPCAELSVEDVGDVLEDVYALREAGSCDYSATDATGKPNAIVQISDVKDFGSAKGVAKDPKAIAGIGKDAYVATGLPGDAASTTSVTAYAELRSGQTLSVTLTGGAAGLDLSGSAEELLRVAYSKL